MELLLHLYPEGDQHPVASFEQLVERMSQVDGLFVEMDGAFVWIDRETHPDQQMDGMIYDRDGRIVYVEVKGNFSKRQLRLLCEWICMPKNMQKNLLAVTEDGTQDEFDRRLRIHCPLRRMWFTMSQVQAMIEG